MTLKCVYPLEGPWKKNHLILGVKLEFTWFVMELMMYIFDGRKGTLSCFRSGEEDGWKIFHLHHAPHNIVCGWSLSMWQNYTARFSWFSYELLISTATLWLLPSCRSFGGTHCIVAPLGVIQSLSLTLPGTSKLPQSTKYEPSMVVNHKNLLCNHNIWHYNVHMYKRVRLGLK